MASAFAAVEPPHHSHRFSADWWKDNERRAAAQRAEQQRIADYYARTTRNKRIARMQRHVNDSWSSSSG